MASAELSRRVEKVVAYSRSPTASRASARLPYPWNPTILPSWKVVICQTGLFDGDAGTRTLPPPS
jgi:hypothetical protein